jgi:hypothetical protein
LKEKEKEMIESEEGESRRMKNFLTNENMLIYELF